MLGRVREAGLVALLALVVIPAGVVRAHEHIPVGPYVLVIGWVHEPVYTGQPNGLDLLIKLEGEPAAEGTADAGHAAARAEWKMWPPPLSLQWSMAASAKSMTCARCGGARATTPQT